MNHQTITNLIALNTQFYETIAKDFSDSRHTAWPGWEELVSIIKKLSAASQTLRVLDMGCGNARFLEFLHATIPSVQITYCGIDTSEKLLSFARQKFSESPNTSFIQSDIITTPPRSVLESESVEAEFDLVVAFGVFHHIPSKINRLSFLKNASNILAPQGLLVVSCWQFTMSENLMKRQVQPSVVRIEPTQLETGDYILDWQRGKTAYRYCHLTSPAEMADLANQAELTTKQFWINDGKTENLNHYYLFEEKEQ